MIEIPEEYIEARRTLHALTTNFTEDLLDYIRRGEEMPADERDGRLAIIEDARARAEALWPKDAP